MINSTPLKISLVSVVIAVFFGAGYVWYDFVISGNQKVPTDAGSEISLIRQTDDLGTQLSLYRKLISRTGPENAQQALAESGLPFTGQTHLLNHLAGEALYEQYGADGLYRCKDYFLGSCYHGFILKAFAVEGEAVLAEMLAACDARGVSVMVQCSHALGHGFLAQVGYGALPAALERCDSSDKRMRTFNCYDGVFMENVWGVHSGSPSPDRWQKSGDPFFPCADNQIAERYRAACWSNQPALLFQTFAGEIEKVSAVCGQLQNEQYTSLCFDGLARQIHPYSKGNPDTVYELCGALPSRSMELCVASIAVAGYSTGDRAMPFVACGKLTDEAQDMCYTRLLSAMRTGGSFDKAECEQIHSDAVRERCMNLVMEK